MRILLTACLLFAAVVIFVQADKDTDFCKYHTQVKYDTNWPEPVALKLFVVG